MNLSLTDGTQKSFITLKKNKKQKKSLKYSKLHYACQNKNFYSKKTLHLICKTEIIIKCNPIETCLIFHNLVEDETYDDDACILEKQCLTRRNYNNGIFGDLSL